MLLRSVSRPNGTCVFFFPMRSCKGALFLFYTLSGAPSISFACFSFSALSAAVGNGEKNKADGPHGAVHTAGLAEDGVNDFVSGPDGVETAAEQIENNSDGVTVRPDMVHPEDLREHDRGDICS